MRIAFFGVLAVAALVRLVALDRIPPGLWYDEAIYALDGLEAATEGPRLFYTTENHMREPLYIWSLGAFFALFGSSVVKARLVSALWGIAAVAVFWQVARRAMRDFRGTAEPLEERTGAGLSGWPNGGAAGAEVWALVAMLAFAVFRWHLHFSRTIFRALLPSLFILLVVWLFRRWRETRRPWEAALCGAAMGAGMYTYLSFRLVPLLIGAWVAWLFWRGILSWRRDWRPLVLTAATSLIVFAPLGIDWVLHPDHFSGRTEEVSMFTKSVKVTGADGAEQERVVPKTVGEAVRDLGGNALQVAGMWTFRGDHVGKHNLPYAPVFDWANGLIFYAGLVWCLIRARRNEWAFLTLVWIGVLSLTSVFSFGAPNILRMQGATPAVILAYVFGLRWMAEGLARVGASVTVRRAAVAGLVGLFAALQLDTYFRRFPVSPQVRQEFQVEMFASPAEGVLRLARESGTEGAGRRGTGGGAGTTILVPEELAGHPTFRFIIAPVEGVRVYGPGAPLPLPAEGKVAVLVTQRSLDLARQMGQNQRVQLHARPDVRLLESFPVTVTNPDGGARRMPWAELWGVR